MGEAVVSGAGVNTAAAAVLSRFDGLLDELLGLDLDAMSSVQLTSLVVGLEQRVRRLPVVDQRLVAALEDRRVAAEFCVSNTSVLLRSLVRISIHEARRRVAAAANLGPRRPLLGEPMPPLFGAVAAAQATGSISAEHAAVITTAIDALPHAVEAEHGDWAQTYLVTQAADLDPTALGKLAALLRDVLDPDATLADYNDHERNRSVTFTARRDGTYGLAGVLTPSCGALWQATMDSLAGPRPTADGLRDPRTAAQRTHDALAEIPALLLRAEQLPPVGGLVATVLVTMTAEQMATGTGLASTGHGDLIPAAQVVQWAGDAQIVPVLLDPHGGILDYGRARRLASPGQRCALFARDRGCTVPDCDIPAAWCQIHHFQEWTADHGSTSIANMGLVCAFHHREFARQGWHGIMLNGLPHWIPPTWYDPHQKPRRNTRHDLLRHPPQRLTAISTAANGPPE